MTLPSLFRRAPPRPRHIPPQPTYEKDWAVGDRAECISVGQWRLIETGVLVPGPDKGQILLVTAVHPFEDSLFLTLKGFARWGFYPAGHFRKLRPCSADFAEQLCRRAPVGVPAIREPEMVP